MANGWLLPVMHDLSGLVARAATARIDSGSRRNAKAEVAKGNADPGSLTVRRPPTQPPG